MFWNPMKRDFPNFLFFIFLIFIWCSFRDGEIFVQSDSDLSQNDETHDIQLSETEQAEETNWSEDEYESEYESGSENEMMNCYPFRTSGEWWVLI